MSIDASKRDLSDVRRDYSLGNLDEDQLNPDPFVQFANWYAEAETACRYYPNNMTVATVDETGQPFIRTVLLKGFSDQGFIFYTNFESRKAQQLGKNPKIALSLFWEELERQVLILGTAKELSRDKVESYFHSRPRGSQIGAWCSKQSSAIDSRKVLEQTQALFEKKFADMEVPLPDFWGGFCIEPTSIEFWQGQPSRLHDRFIYKKQDDASWNIQRLSP